MAVLRARLYDMERQRAADELDGFMWFCDECDTKLYEEFLHVEDIGRQFRQQVVGHRVAADDHGQRSDVETSPVDRHCVSRPDGHAGRDGPFACH